MIYGVCRDGEVYYITSNEATAIEYAIEYADNNPCFADDVTVEAFEDEQHIIEFERRIIILEDNL